MTQHILPDGTPLLRISATRPTPPNERPRFDGVRVRIDPGAHGRTADLVVDGMDIRYEPFHDPDGTQKSLVHFQGVVRSFEVESPQVTDQQAEVNPLEGEDPDPMQTVYKTWKSCKACGLHQYRSQIVFGDGNAIDPSVLIIGEAPGPEEDKQGTPFIGPTGQLLRNTLLEVGLDPVRDCYITNSVLCFPKDEHTGGFRGPLAPEVLPCRERLRSQFRIVGPKVRVVLLLGKRAFASFLRPDLLKSGHLDTDRGWSDLKMKDALGWYSGQLPRKFGDTKVYTTWHPSYIYRQRQSRAQVLPVEWKLDLQAVAAYALHGKFTDPRVRKP